MKHWSKPHETYYRDGTLTYQHTKQACKIMSVSSNFNHSKDVNFEVTPNIKYAQNRYNEEIICSSEQWNDHNHNYQHHQHC
jgi:uncharacterized membrane protein